MRTERRSLEVDGVASSFGNFVALNKVSVAFQPGKLTAIIGPNGAGKSTFFNVCQRRLPADRRPACASRAATSPACAQHEFARIGIAKSFQITNVFKQLQAHENVRVAAQMRRGALPAVAPRAQLMAGLIERADACSSASAWPIARDKPARRSGARPAARAGDRDGAGQRARAAADGRAHRRHVARGNHGHDGPDHRSWPPSAR